MFLSTHKVICKLFYICNYLKIKCLYTIVNNSCFSIHHSTYTNNLLITCILMYAHLYISQIFLVQFYVSRPSFIQLIPIDAKWTFLSKSFNLIKIILYYILVDAYKYYGYLEAMMITSNFSIIYKIKCQKFI